MTTIRAITLNWNGADDTLACLRSLDAQTGVDCRPLVVDNGSTDDSRALFPADIDVVATGSNLGFCGGNNRAIARGLEEKWDFFFLVNNDTLMEPDCLENMVRCAEQHPKAAVIGPAIYFEADRARPWFAGGRADFTTGAVSHVTTVPAAPGQTDWVSGCAMLIRAARLREIGGFDERFFCYYEDADWCLRARSANYSCLICPTATLYHKIAGTSDKQGGKKFYYSTRNHLLFLQTHAPPALLARAVRRSLKRIRKEVKRHNALAHLLGVRDFCQRRFGPCPYPWL